MAVYGIGDEAQPVRDALGRYLPPAAATVDAMLVYVHHRAWYMCIVAAAGG